jgi:D-arabinose 1-dehydrogenase-like Zn-dependent alcohol dehydrogenase
MGGVGRTAVHVARKHGARVLAGVRAKEKDEAAKLNADGVVAIDSEEEIVHLHDLFHGRLSTFLKLQSLVLYRQGPVIIMMRSPFETHQVGNANASR